MKQRKTNGPAPRPGGEAGAGGERAVAYARVSTEMQAEEGLSIAAQLAEIREFAAARGWQVVNEFVDAGITGQTLDRPGLQAVLLAAAQGAFDILVVHELSRLSRSSVYETFAIFEQLGRHGVGFASVKEPQFDLSNPTGRFLLTIIAAINQYYIDILRLHTRKAKRERAREGLYNASVAPYGYALSGSPRAAPVVVAAEAEVVRFLFEHYASGRYSIEELTELINERGWRTRTGRRFSVETVNDMLRNPFYAGKVVYRAGQRARGAGEVFEGQHEALVTPELWAACERVRQRRWRQPRAVHQGAAVGRYYLLSQVARCHLCGRPLRAQGAESGNYYREVSFDRGYDDCPNMRLGTRAEPLHAQIGAIVRQLQLPADWQAELATLLADTEEAATLANRRARLEAERRRLKEAYVRGDFAEDEDIYRRELERIRRELAQLPGEEQMREVQEAAELLGSLVVVWDEAEEADRRTLVRLMLRQVQVDVACGRLMLLQPTAPFVPLFRRIPLLAERGLGHFVPVWPPEQAAEQGLTVLPALRAVDERPVAPPFVVTWPWSRPEGPARMSPALSEVLRRRRQAGHEGGVVGAVAAPGVPRLRLDHRRWPAVQLRELTLAEALALPAGTLAVLDTPLGVAHQAEFLAALPRVQEVLATGGYWRLVLALPGAMPAHWVYTYFPEAWGYVSSDLWDSARYYNALREAGFGVLLREHRFYQAVSVAAAQALAQRRPGLLGLLAEAAYAQGMRRLAAEAERRGAEALVGSEFTLVEILAVKGERIGPTRRRLAAALADAEGAGEMRREQQEG